MALITQPSDMRILSPMAWHLLNIYQTLTDDCCTFVWLCYTYPLSNNSQTNEAHHENHQHGIPAF
ncbi:hypothetical protein CCP4SC76_3290003 [Gammaproteobacteria bacterium]